MQGDLLIPNGFAPSNLHLPHEAANAFIEGDVYNIAERIQEINDIDLHIWPLPEDHPAAEGGKYRFSVVETCTDGEFRLVFKCAELDARIVTRLQYLAAKPFDERYAELERMEHRVEEQNTADELDDLYERMGRPMWTQLDHDGFIAGGRGVSYPKIGVAAPGRAR